MENLDDVESPFRWLDGDGFWTDLLAVVFSGSTWPEGSENAVWDLADEWAGLAQGLADSSDLLQTAAVDLLAAWDAPAAGTFDDLARSLLGSPDVGLPGHVQNASAVAGQVSGFGVDLQYAKVSVNIAVAVAAMAAVIGLVMAPVGGLSLVTLGPAAQIGRQAVLRALEQLATAAGRRAVVRDMGRAVADAAVLGAGRTAGHSATHRLAHEVVEEVLEELVIDVGTQTYQVSDGTRTDWNGLSTVMAAVGGGVGGAVGAGAVAPVLTRLRSTRQVTAIAGLGADGRFLARGGNVGIRVTGGLAATASTNAVASPVGGVAASLLTGQGFPALDASTFGMAAMAALGRYGTVSPTNPAVLTAAVHPAQTLARVHVDALAGHTAQQALRSTLAEAETAGGKAYAEPAPHPVDRGHAVPDRTSTGSAQPTAWTTAPPAGSGPSTAAHGPATAAPEAASDTSSADPDPSGGPVTTSVNAATSDAAKPTPDVATPDAVPPDAAPPAPSRMAGLPPDVPAPGAVHAGILGPTDPLTTSDSPTSTLTAPAGGAAISPPNPLDQAGPPAHAAPSGQQPADPNGPAQLATTTPTLGDLPAADLPVDGGPPVVDPGVTAGPAPTSPLHGATPGVGAEAGLVPEPGPVVAEEAAHVGRSDASPDRLAGELTAVAAESGVGPVSRADVEQALLPRSAQAGARRSARARGRERALGELAARKAARRAAGTHESAGSGHAQGGPGGGGLPPGGPPSAEQALYDGMPEALRRYLMEAVAHGQVWADLVQDQLVDVVAHLAAQGLPVAEAVGLANAVKSLQSAARKIQPSIQGGSTFAATIWSMDDLVRFSLQIDPERYGESVLEALEVFRALGWSVPAVPGPGEKHDDWRNTWAIGNRHHGLLVVMTHAVTGQRVEMQFPTPQSWRVGKQTHDLYETIRFEDGDAFERVVALGRILDIVQAEGVTERFPLGLESLGPAKLNGPSRMFEKEPLLAARFGTFAERKYGSALNALIHAKISPASAELIADAVTTCAAPLPTKDKEDIHDRSQSPGLAAMGTDTAEGPGKLGEVPGDGRAPWTPMGSVHGASGGPGPGTIGSAGAARGRGDRAGEGVRLPDRDLAQVGDQAGSGDPLGGGRRTGDHPVRRPQRDLDLGPEERQRDRAPGGRGPLRPAGAGDPGGSGSAGSPEGDDAADPGTAAGDVPHPGGPGAGDVGDPGGPRGAAQPAALTDPLAVGADAAAALEHLLAETDPPRLWQGVDGEVAGQVLQLADGSSVRITTGRNPWARTDPGRPLQMWSVGSFHLDDGPLTPAASAFLVDLRRALRQVEHREPSSHWLSQRATLDPRTHRITEPGVARPYASDAAVLVWDAAQGWVDAPRSGGLARVIDERLVPAAVFASWVEAAAVVEGAEQVLALIEENVTAEAEGDDGARAHRRAALRTAGGEWVADAVGPTMAVFLDQRTSVLAASGGRLLMRFGDDRLAVVSVAEAENEALSGSRPGLQQAGSTTDIGQLRNELAAHPEHEADAAALTQELQQGTVRHFRVQGVLSGDGFVGMRVTEFEVIRPAHDDPGVLRSRTEPHRLVDPGLATREAVQHALAGWTPVSVTDAVANAERWLPLVNPHHGAFPATDRMPWSTNCGDCSRAVVDLLQGRDARAAFGDNGARVLDDHTHWGTGPGELHEMRRWADAEGSWHTWHDHGSTFDPGFTAHADARIGAALAAQPGGTVAIVLVNWADPTGGQDEGHWFTAAVTEDGVEWIDGQSAQHRAWPPSYPRPYFGNSVITRAQGSDTWLDLFVDPVG